MHIEHIANGNEMIDSADAWSSVEVLAADRRYITIYNQPRNASVAPPPSIAPADDERRSSSFCQLLKAKQYIVDEASEMEDNNDWLLIRCSENLLKEGENMKGKTIAVNWNNDGTWFLAKVEATEGFLFKVTFYCDGSYDKLRLVGFGYKLPPAGNGVNWRLLARSTTANDYEHSGVCRFLFVTISDE